MAAMTAMPGHGRTAAGSANAWSAAGAGVGASLGGPVPPRARDLLGRADALLAEAVCADEADAAERFRLAYVAAVRGAAAVLEIGPVSRRRGASRSAWEQLRCAVPALTGWADYFAGHSAAREAVEAGVTGRVGRSSAEEVVAAAREFLDAVEDVVVSGASSAGAAAGAVREPLRQAG